MRAGGGHRAALARPLRARAVLAPAGTAADRPRLAAELLAAAEATEDPSAALAAHNRLGVTAFYTGEFAEALGHLDRGIALYDPDLHGAPRSQVFRVGQDPGVSCMAHAALALWMLGHPARAVARMREALALARSLEHPFSLSYGCHFAAVLQPWLAGRRAVQALEDEGVRIDTEHGFWLFLSTGAVYRGWLLDGAGHGLEGLAQMQQAVARYQKIGAGMLFPMFLALVAGAQERLGRIADGLATVSEALATGQEAGQRYWEAELRRLKGKLTLRTEAQTARDAGVRRPRSGGARVTPWRPPRPRRRRPRRCSCRPSRWRGEGLDTADLIEARALLDRLGR